MRHDRFTALLMAWHHSANRRDMPWKGEKDPYRIWLSEVILQQTRVEQGRGYYEAFVRAYPTIHHLAAAPDEDVFKHWEGLGYYTRCRNLLVTAREIAAGDGVFPSSYPDILRLKGVGPYTAAAIASFAFGLPHAVVDGNVFRVLARVFGIHTPIDSAAGKQEFTALAGRLLNTDDSGAYNQAIMDFGATICKPLAPRCADCPLRRTCTAYRQGSVNILPVKEKILRRSTRWFYYFIFRYKGQLLVRKRTEKDIWQDLHEFYLFESPASTRWNDAAISEWLREQFGIRDAVVESISPLQSQTLTHREIRGQFITVSLKKLPPGFPRGTWHPEKRIRELAFPRYISQYLDGL